MSKKLKFDEFLRAVAISKNDIYSLLLGAGCSISSDILSAEDCIWEWKKTIYKTNNVGTQNWIENCKNPKVQAIIQNWLDIQGEYIERDSKEEYSFYAQKCFPVEEHRRQYFQKICANKTPSIGYRTIPLLMKQGLLDSVWTTNIDDLVITACIHGAVQGVEITLDSVQRLSQRNQNRNELPVIKLHGDFKYGELKNTDEELRNQDSVFRQKLIEYVRDKHLIVIGYSGRDSSLMDTLKEAYSQDGGGMLFWCGYGDRIASEVEELINAANTTRKAFYVSTEGFDTTLLNLARLITEDNDNLKQGLEALQQCVNKDDSTIPFNLKPARVNKVLKSNCFQIKFPEEVFVFDAEITEKPWQFIKERSLTSTDISAVPYKKQIWAFGTLDKIKDAFEDVIQGDITRKPLTNIRIYNSATKSLLLSTICKIFAAQFKLETNYKNKVWSEKQSKTICDQTVFDAIEFSFEKVDGNYVLTLNPNFALKNNDIDNLTKQKLGLSFFHKIWNSQYNDYIDKWRKTLLSQSKYEFPLNSGTGFTFNINKAPVFTEICDLNNKYTNSHNVPETMTKLKGVQFKEPNLVFSTKNGNRNTTDFHPMRGLVENRPFETGLNSFLGDTINLGVISPSDDAPKLYNFLQQQNAEIQNPNTKDQYVIDFKGFHKTYGVSLNIPTTDDSNWMKTSEPIEADPIRITHEIKKCICDNITKIEVSGSCKIVIIYIPQRWEHFTGYNIDGESFDLHDYIKAFCVEKGIMSQLIREKTITDDTQSCQINWWLSLSYYVKSLRTPWILSNVDESTAFAGLGYSLDNQENENGHIVLGCSHIYSSTGEGLKYKLSKISNDKIQWRHKKPHLFYDDAYEFGRNIINLFYESVNELPKRVVVHKRTFFTEEETRGILDSLYDNKKIESIDLVEINFEDDIRYVASKILNGKTQIDGFSVSRGTCIQLNAKEALLWAHGVVPSVRNPRYHFYPGGRYIPKPLRVIKHYGKGSLEQIANEILGLTKMNWNSLNMYSQLPATISSSNDIARIGKLIEHKGKIEYDYRYFI